jgi:hypothetical protein
MGVGVAKAMAQHCQKFLRRFFQKAAAFLFLRSLAAIEPPDLRARAGVRGSGGGGTMHEVYYLEEARI